MVQGIYQTLNLMSFFYRKYFLFSVRIIGLDDNTNYKIKIYTEQISTHLLSKSIDLSFITKQSSMKKFFFENRNCFFLLVSKQIRGINIRRITFNTVVITWLADEFDRYQLRYWSLIDENKKNLFLLTINNFTLITTSDIYKFQIRGHTKFGWTSYTQETLISLRSIFIDQPISSDVTKKFVDNKNILLISPLIILGLIIAVIILAVLYIKK